MATLHLAETCDVPGMLAIYAEYITNSTASFEYQVPTEEEFTQRVQDTLKNTPWIVARDGDGNVVGFAYGGKHRKREGYSWCTEVSIYLAESYLFIDQSSAFMT